MLASATDRARLLFRVIPARLRSSITIVANHLAISLVSLCAASFRLLAIRSYNRAKAAFAFFQLAEPSLLRLRDLHNWRSFFDHLRNPFGPSSTSPLDSVASVLTPRSTPTTSPWFSAFAGLTGTSTPMLTYHRSATRETVADKSFPWNRSSSHISDPA